MAERKAPPRGVTCVIQNLRNSYCIAGSFRSSREDDGRTGTVRVRPDSFVAHLARAERSLPKGRVTIGEFEVWFLEREAAPFGGPGGEKAFLEGLEGLLAGEVPAFVGLSTGHEHSLATLLNLLDGATGGGFPGLGVPGRGGGPSGGPGGGWPSGMGGPSGWLGALIPALGGFLGGVAGRTGQFGWGGFGYTSGPNEYGGKTVTTGSDLGERGGFHGEKVYDANGTLREKHSYTIGGDGSWWAERHTYFDESGKKVGGRHEHHDVEQEELAKAAWEWFGGDDSSESGSDSLTVVDEAPGPKHIPPDVEQVRVAWEVAEAMPLDEEDIDHLPIDPASGQRAVPEAGGVGLVVVGQTTDDGYPEAESGEFRFPGGGLGVPRSRKRDQAEPRVWYQVFVIDPPDLVEVIEAADRLMDT